MTLSVSRPGTRDRVAVLQARIRDMQAPKLATRAVPTLAACAGFLPDGTLREGTIIESQGSLRLVMSLLAGASQAGRWTAVVGVPEFGVEAAASFGIALDRLVLVPRPGPHWLTVVATLAEVVAVISVRPTSRVSAGERARLEARLRDRSASVIVAGEWAGADVSLRASPRAWSGLGAGYGLLDATEIDVAASGRGAFVVPRHAGVRFVDGGVEALAPKRVALISRFPVEGASADVPVEGTEMPLLARVG
ncbi:MAG TPA: hypothetical protein VFU07_06180 [Candidatus Lumbricidophila sp.]|nr:hypothetical protein [Candidatus Lumbricidophila sp.]